MLKEELPKKTFYDALTEVSTDEAIRICAKLANQRQFDDGTLLNFYMNIAFATAPGTKSLEALTILVKALE